MLNTFRFGNFRSYDANQLLSFACSPGAEAPQHCIRTDNQAIPHLLRSAVVFGANGSGKTNLIAALKTFRHLALRSSAFSETQLGETYTPFRLGDKHGRATEFGVDIVLKDARYRYDIAYDASRIRFERLLVYHTGKPQRWFERRYDANTAEERWGSFSQSFHGPRESWRKATSHTALFLTTAARLNCAQLKPIVDWFEQCIEFVPVAFEDLSELAVLLGNHSLKARLLTFLQSLDLHIHDARPVALDPRSSRSHNSEARATSLSSRPMTVELLHQREGMAPAWLKPSQESSGLHTLLAMFVPLQRATELERLLVVDDFGSRLHPLVARALIAQLSESALGRRGQNLLTSHSTALMDLEILRRDEIWLAELDAARASRLYPALRHGTRKHEAIGKRYLQGRYGGVPTINSGEPD